MATFTFAHPAPPVGVGTITFSELKDVVAAKTGLAWLHPIENRVTRRKREFNYPGADGIHIMRLGRNDQLFVLTILVIAETEQALETLIDQIREAQDDQPGDLKFRDTVAEHDFCILESATFDRHKFIPGDGLFYQEGTLTFRKLAPNRDAGQGWGG